MRRGVRVVRASAIEKFGGGPVSDKVVFILLSFPGYPFFKVSRVRVAHIAHANRLAHKFFCVNQSETRCPVVFPVLVRVAFTFRTGTPSAALITEFMVSPNSSKPKRHLRSVSNRMPRGL